MAALAGAAVGALGKLLAVRALMADFAAAGLEEGELNADAAQCLGSRQGRQPFSVRPVARGALDHCVPPFQSELQL